MKEEYINNIKAHKEVLQTLPKNNQRNINEYNKTVEGLIQTYRKNLQEIKEEIIKRNNNFTNNISQNIKLSELDKRSEELIKEFVVINRYNSPYEKSGLDKLLNELSNISNINLEEVNNKIYQSINKFKEIGINLTNKDFKYSYYSNLYMDKLLSLSEKKEYNEEFKIYFEKIYWKCPNIINHIIINIKNLYYKNIKRFEEYYKNKSKNLELLDIRQEYIDIQKDKDELIMNDKYIILNKFLNDELNINDYNPTKINPIRNKYKNQEIDTDQEFIELAHTLYEYKEYIDLLYIVKDIKKLYESKNSYKGIYLKKKKEIVKLEKNITKENRKVNIYIRKNNNKKLDFCNNKINNYIIDIKQLYEELEKNYFLEKIASLDENSTILDILYLVASNYNYLEGLLRDKEIDVDKEITRINNLIYYPYLNLINNIWIDDEKKINQIIRDKYLLVGLNIEESLLEEDNISLFIDEINKINNYLQIIRNNLSISKIEFIKQSNTIIEE